MKKRGQNNPNWYLEFLNPYEIHSYGLKNIVRKTRTKYQDALIIDTFPYGRCLFLDGKIQSAELDEFIYHEALVHPALFSHKCPRRIFVGGAGEGATLREILKHPCVKSVTTVDIDREVVELAKKYLFRWHRGAFVNRKVKLHFLDARKYLRETKELFDCIFLDLCDPGDAEGPSARLFTKEFYSLAKKRLAPGGILTIQCGSTNLNMLKGYAHVYKTLRSVFDSVLPYQADISSFVGPWGYCLAFSAGIKPPSAEIIKERMKERGFSGRLRFYGPEIHGAMFALPQYLRDHFKKGRIIYDRNPYFLSE